MRGLAGGAESVKVMLRRASIVTLALAAATAARAQPNDSFAARISLGSANPANTTGTNVGATKEGGEPNHAGSPGGRSVWWSWTAPANGVATVSTSGSNFDTLVGVYTGAAVGSLTFVAANDDTPVPFVLGVSQKTSLATFNAVSATTYQIAVDGFFNAAGSVSLGISLAAGSAPPTLSISDASLSEQDFGVTSAAFAVTLSAATTLPVNVAYATGGGTAAAGVDYAATSGVLHFSPGQTAAIIAVTVLGDATVEANETFNVMLSAPTNATIADATGVGTLTNDDGVASTSTDLAWQTGTVGASLYPGMTTINGVAFGSALYVVVGDYGDIWTSPDTNLWTPRANPDGRLRPLRGVAFGGGTFVAVGGCCPAFGGGEVLPGYTGGPILTSTNGTNWTFQLAVGERSLHGVAFGNGRFVAVGARGTVIGSINGGVGWQFAAVSGIPDFMGVAFGGGAFVAVGEGGSIIRSTDGTTWAQGIIGAEDLRAVTHAGTQFVAVGASGTILTSLDGLAWTFRGSGTQASLTGVAFSGTTIAAVGANVALSSADGVTWTPRVIPGVLGASTAYRAVGFGSVFVAGADDGAFSTSPDGVTWTNRTFVTSGVYRAVAFSGTATYCAVGNAGSVASSTNGQAWVLQSGIGSRPLWPWKSVASNGTVFAAVGDGAEIMSSTDCATWTERNAGAIADPATGIAGHLSDVTFGGGVFAAVGEEMPNAGEGVALVATSPDGTTWTERTVSGLTTDEHALTAVAQGGGRFVALGMNRATGRTVAAISTDGGTTWTGQTLAAFGPYEEVNDLAFGGGAFVAVGDRIWSSPDGLVWTPRRGFGAQPLRTVTFGNGRFMAGGDVGTLLGSEDGTFWAENLGAAHQDVYGLVAGPGGTPDLLVGVGDSVTLHSGTPVRPPNDNLANATVIAGAAFTANGSNVYGTKEPGEPSHAGGLGGRSVWWSWTAPQTGKAMVRTLGSGIDTLLAVYSGTTMATLNLVGSNDDFAAAVTSRARFDAVSGTTYRFAIDGFGGAAGPITISGGMAPVNDDFAERIDLPQFTAGTTGSSVNATYEASEPIHAGNPGGRSVWWNWTAPASGTVTLTTAGSSVDTLLAVYTGNVLRLCSPPAVQPPNCLTQVAANDDQTPGVITTSLATFPVVAGTAYRIAVDGFNGASGNVTLGLTLTVPPPSLFVSDVSVTEGQAGTKLATFTISLSGATNQTVTVNYATANGTATAGSDYVAVSSTLVTFTPGQTSQQVSVTVNGDTTIEASETLIVNLSNPVNAIFTGGDPSGVGSIVNDDTQVSIDDVGTVEPPTGTRDALFTITLSPPLTASSVSVQFATANGTASSPNDYTGAASTITIPANTPAQTLAVAILADNEKEGQETFTVTLSNPNLGTSIARAVGTGRIFDPGNLFTVTPCRLADTRGAEGPALTPGPDRTFAVAGRCGIPATAHAASVNITVTQGTDPGNLRLYPAGDALPLASAINYGPGQTRANNAVIPLGASGQIAVRLDQGAGSLHFILDVNGYIE